MASLLERNGLRALVAPVMKEVPLAPTHESEAFAKALREGTLDVVVLLTGVGTRALAAMLEPALPRTELAQRLSSLVVAARGPKTVAALKELGVTGYLVAPEPFTWDLLVETLAARTPLHGKRVVVQEYGVPHPRLLAALGEHGAIASSLSVYKWTLPDDVAPARAAIDALLRGEAEAALFTSAPQIDHLLEIAEAAGVRDALLAALDRAVVGSVGPTCSERLRARGVPPDVEPAHAHMGQLAKAVAERLAARHHAAK